MIARARTAKTSQKVNDMLSSMTGTTSMDAFERMKEKVRRLAQASRIYIWMCVRTICELEMIVLFWLSLIHI